MEDLSVGAQTSISHLSSEKQEYILQLTQKYGEYLIKNGGDIFPGLGYWEETVEYVEQVEIREVKRLLRKLNRMDF